MMAVGDRKDAAVRETLDAAPPSPAERLPAERLPVRLPRIVLLAVVALVAAATCVQAQDYPVRAVAYVVPFPPGGATDLLSRIVAQNLERRLGKPFVIENRPGGGTSIATGAVAKAAPDGYTLLSASVTSLAVNPTLFKALPYDSVKDFVPIALVGGTPFALIVNPSLPVHSVADLIKLAREKPGELSYGSAGVGTPHHLYIEMIKSMTGIEMQHVPYRGSLAALTDLVAGHIPLMICDLAPAMEMIESGKVRALGISIATRLPELPNIPPIGDTIPGFDATGWQMVVAPAATPAPIVERLHVAIEAIMDQPEIRTELIRLGMTPHHTPSVADLRAMVKSERERWAKIVQQAGVAGSQ
jgi:tripartite-type tricarboxylate transporter receptor subunit TctC